MEKQLKEIIRSVIREEFISELSKNDVHVKEIMKFYDKGSYSTKKAVSIYVCNKTNATRNQILDELGDLGYNDVWEILDHFKLTIEGVNEADVVPGGLAKGLSLNDIAEKHGVSVDMMVGEFKKGIAVEMEHTTDREVAKEITLDHLFEDPKYYDKLKKVEEYVDDKGVEHVAAALPQTEEEPIEEAFKHTIHVDTPTQVVSKPIAAQIMALAKKGVRSKDIGLEMGFTGNAKLAADTFQKVKNQIYFALDKRNEATTSTISGNSGRTVSNLDNKKYELKRDVKGAKIGSFVNLTLPKGTIIYNLPGGVFANHISLKQKFNGSNNPKWNDTFGVRITSTPNTLDDIEKNSKILESNISKNNYKLKQSVNESTDCGCGCE